jgi:hypothetical protein
MNRWIDIGTSALTALLLLLFALLSLRGLIDPQPASARFGAAVTDSAGELYYRVYLSRNVVIVVAGGILLLLGQWRALAILISVTAALPVFDMSVLSLNGATPPAFHALALVLLGLAALLLWRRALGRGT